MKPTINQALSYQFSGIYKCVGVIGVTSLSGLVLSVLSMFIDSDIIQFAGFIVILIGIVGAMGYIYSSFLEAEIIDEHAEKNNVKKPTWRDDKFLLHVHQKSMEIACYVLILVLFLLFQMGDLEIDSKALFTTRQVIGLIVGVTFTLYFLTVVKLLKN